MDGSRDVTFCNRWERPELFTPPREILHDPTCMLHSIAGWLNFTASNIHDYIMSSDVSKWIKIPAMLLLDAALLTLPVLALAEASIRLALAIITSPLLLGKFCFDTKWTNLSIFLLRSTSISLAEVPNSLYTIYQTQSSDSEFDVHTTSDEIRNIFSKDIKIDTFILSLASCVNIVFANLVNFLNKSKVSSWIKTPCILVLNALLIATVPVVALAETVLRLALAVFTSPLLLTIFCSKSDWKQLPIMMAITSIYSICQIPSALYSLYLSHTSSDKINAGVDGHGGRITKMATCGLVN